MSYRMSRHHASEHADCMCPYEQIKQVNNTRELFTQFGATSPTSGGSKPGRKSTLNSVSSRSNNPCLQPSHLTTTRAIST
ncbi:hypothetical protein GmHk_19G054367 [Glycine max]|nr:hypothetical protein GmHk_19G054367 [Glycine max]